jgi:hypothetical protein
LYPLCLSLPIGQPGNPIDSVELAYHGGSGTDKYFRLEAGEHINRITGRYGADHIENLVFHTTRNRASESFGTAGGTDFKAEAPEGKILHHIAGRSDGYLNAIKFYWGDIPVETFTETRVAASQTFGAMTGRPFDDALECKGMILRSIHLRAASAVDGIQMTYAEGMFKWREGGVAV